jgi:hypothetical protein
MSIKRGEPMRIGAVLVLSITCVLTAGGCASFGAVAGRVDASMLDPAEVGGVSQEVDFIANKGLAPATSFPGKGGDAAAAAPPPLAVPGSANEPAASNPAPAARQVVYSAAFRVVVADVPGSLSSIRQHTESLGGHLQEVDGQAITVRVPAARFNDAVAFVERAGEVVARQVKAQDVTDAMRDLRTHLDNQEKLRQRFQALLEKADKVEDALKIEAELARVTEELDRAKGKLWALEAQVSMSTIRVELNAPAVSNTTGTGPGLPFDWVNELGDGLVAGQVRPNVRRAGVFGRGPRFQPPAGFVRYYEADGETEAMDAAGLRLRVQRRDNVDRADLRFWSTLVRKTLVENRSLAVTHEETGQDFYTLEGTRDVGGKPVGYLLSLERSNNKVVVFEAWGSRDQFDANRDALRTSALSINP